MYQLEAIIARRDQLAPIEQDMTSFRLVGRTQEIAVAPLGTALMQELGLLGGEEQFNPLHYPPHDPPDWPPQLLELCEICSRNGIAIATYVCCFGGPCDQATFIWRDGACTDIIRDDAENHQPRSRTALSQGLAALGVTRDDHLDEFDTINMGEFRETAEWIGEPLD